MMIELRLATVEDADFLLACRNDIQTRKASHNTGSVTKEEHVHWLNKILKDENRTLYIAEQSGMRVGTARADKLENKTELSWTVSPDSRGKGIGKEIVKAISPKIHGPIYAEIKKENLASVNIAKSIGMILNDERNGVLYFIRN